MPASLRWTCTDCSSSIEALQIDLKLRYRSEFLAMDYKAEQEMELEALEAILMEDFSGIANH